MSIDIADIPGLALKAAILYTELVKNGVPEKHAVNAMIVMIGTGGKVITTDSDDDQPWKS